MLGGYGGGTTGDAATTSAPPPTGGEIGGGIGGAGQGASPPPAQGWEAARARWFCDRNSIPHPRRGSSPPRSSCGEGGDLKETFQLNASGRGTKSTRKGCSFRFGSIDCEKVTFRDLPIEFCWSGNGGAARVRAKMGNDPPIATNSMDMVQEEHWFRLPPKVKIIAGILGEYSHLHTSGELSGGGEREGVVAPKSGHCSASFPPHPPESNAVQISDPFPQATPSGNKNLEKIRWSPVEKGEDQILRRRPTLHTCESSGHGPSGWRSEEIRA